MGSGSEEVGRTDTWPRGVWVGAWVSKLVGVHLHLGALLLEAYSASALSLSPFFFFILNDFIFKRYIDIYTCTEDVFHVHGLGSYLRASAHWEIIFYKNKAENNTAQFRT